MIAPRQFVRYKGEEFALELRGEAWAIGIGDGWYFLTAGGPDPAAVGRFLRARLTNASTPRRPGFLASARYPLLVTIDGVLVRAWPAFVPRGTGAKTFLHPTIGRRVATEKGPHWLFAAGREKGVGGTVTAEQTVADVEDMAAVWLRSG